VYVKLCYLNITAAIYQYGKIVYAVYNIAYIPVKQYVLAYSWQWQAYAVSENAHVWRICIANCTHSNSQHSFLL